MKNSTKTFLNTFKNSTPMKVDLNIRYTEMVVPPRCRKPRPEEGVATISVNIKDVPAERAPVAFIVKEFERQRREVRLYAGKLYRQIQDQRDRSQDCESNMPLWITQSAAKEIGNP